MPGVTGDIGCSIDFYPTILDAAKVPQKADPQIDGISLLPLSNRAELKPREIYWHYPHYANQGSRPGGAIRRGDYKLIRHYEDGRLELYDVKRDISENRNLVAEQPAVVQELARSLASWQEQVGAKMPMPNPDYKPNPQDKDGLITMHARTALVTGSQLRFEPLPHKNTLGFWTNKDDLAAFDFTVEKPGAFTVEVLQGCGKGNGGAEVELLLSGPGIDRPTPLLNFTVKDTGGFQNFEAREVGAIKLDKAGRHTLLVVPKTKPGVAVMDLRQIILKPVQ
jgi:hypothetical protein